MRSEIVTPARRPTRRQPKFLVVTTVLNSEAWIQGALDSVRTQDYQNWRHLILDAGSTDQTVNILKRHVATERRAEFICQPGLEFYPALFELLSRRNANEQVLSWLNADDRYPPWTLSVIARHLLKREPNEPVWISGMPAIRKSNGAIDTILPVGRRFQSLIANGWYHDEALGCIQQESVFFSRTLLEKLSRQDIEQIASMKLAGDFKLWRSFARHAPLSHIPTLIGAFTVTGQNRSRQQQSDYQSEVYAAGGKNFPGFLRPLLRNAHDIVSAISLVKASRQSMRENEEELAKTACDRRN